MANHSNRAKFRYIVSEGGEQIARFLTPEHAQGFAAFLSDEMMICTEVHAPDGIIGQYVDGMPTPEFAGREDAVRRRAPATI